MAVLPPLFPARDPSRVQFSLADGLGVQNLPEPGMIYDGALHDAAVANFDTAAQITDLLPTGTFNSTATWRLTITPTTTPWGSAAADGMAAAYVEFVAVAKTQAEVVAGLIAAATASATPTSLAAADAWNRLRSYVIVALSPVDPSTKIRLTSVTAGQAFEVAISSTVGGDSGTQTAIQEIPTTTAKCGLYYAIDLTKGTNGRDAKGKVYLTPVTSATLPENIVGPVEFGQNTKPVERGYWCREYERGDVVPYTKYGNVTAYGEAAIALSSGPEPVFVRHTVDSTGAYVPGMAADATRAAVDATPNKWTGTPTAADDTLFVVGIQVVNNSGVLISEVISFQSGTSATATTITTGLKAALAAKASLTGLVTGSGTTTFIVDGPADGRAVTIADNGPGIIAFVETDAEVSTHHLLTRGDKFIVPTTRVGAAPVAVPHF